MTFDGAPAVVEALVPVPPPRGHGGRLYGVYPAVVTRIEGDPDGIGRVCIRLPWATDPDGTVYTVWARIATLMAGSDRGTWFIPEPEDEVLVAFEAGDPRWPYVLGGLWNGKDNPHEKMQPGNPIRSIKSRSGIKVTFDDHQPWVQFTIETPNHQQIVCSDKPPSIEITDASQNRISMTPTGITIDTPGVLRVSASRIQMQTADVEVCSGSMRCTGVIQSQANVTSTTVSACYMPGAGNIL